MKESFDFRPIPKERKFTVFIIRGPGISRFQNFNLSEMPSRLKL